jgi:TnpA family transposase
LARTEQYLREQRILFPAEDTLRRQAVIQREKARHFIYNSMAQQLTTSTIQMLDNLLIAGDTKYSKLQKIKMPPLNPSVEGVLRLTEKLDIIESTGIISLDFSWLNNNYQRTLAKYAQRYSAFRLKETEPSKRYAMLVCFLCQSYRETVDYLADTYFKLITRIYNKAGRQQDKANKKQSKKNRASLIMFDTVSGIVLDSNIPDIDVRQHIFQLIPKKSFISQSTENKKWLTGKHSHIFKSVISRFNYMRQFAPKVLSHLQFKDEGKTHTNLLNAISTLKSMNELHQRKLPIDVSVDFIPKKIRALIKKKESIERHGWECAVLTAIRDEVKAGNLSVNLSKRFGHFNDFFMPYSEWEKRSHDFFKRAKLPQNPQDVPNYLTARLNKAIDQFIELEDVNEYAKVEDGKWDLSVDEAEKISVEDQIKLDKLKDWLSSHMRTIKLADLLVEVDNDLHLTTDFFMSSEKTSTLIDDIGAIIATWMAHGCFIGTKTMARLIKDVSYSQIKGVTDWQLPDEAQRGALARTVNAITALEVSESWGDGSSSSSDNENYEFKGKVLQRSYCPKFGDFALEFYMFIADNYAPYYSMPIEAAHRDSPYVLDGALYNESDLSLEDHYVDTHGYMEINFAGFAMLGRRLNPRIKNVKHQRIYRIDTTKNYSSLGSLLDNKKNTIHMDWIVEQWDRMGQFYASFESGQTTASVAMKRLASFTGKNNFYRANREFGRVIKTENILNHMCDPVLRRKRQRGLLKGEQMHQLARNIAYGKRGKITARDLQGQKITCNCLTLLMACIIYWQAKEIMRVIKECNPELAGIDLRMLEHISPAEWDNLILYGEYIIRKYLIKR